MRMPSLLLSALFVPIFSFSSLIAKRTTNQEQKQTTYRVQAGDTWWGIAKKFNLKPNVLTALNGRKDSDALFLNETLRIAGNGLTQNEIKAQKPKQKPVSPLPSFERIEKNFSEVTHLPHKGIEFTRERSAWVRSSLPGKVVTIDFMDGYENYVVVEHENGWYSVYGNLERVMVTEGQVLTERERIGTLVKNRGLYFQVNQNKIPVNPILFLQGT